VTPLQRAYQRARDTLALLEEDPRALVGIELENAGSPLQRRRAIFARHWLHGRY